ncbi:Helix-turn-helix [Desulfovibrio desulfuricans]|uniref:Helix-turn-helix n=2 Tax=Desulfovibrio TaxID=872 RepID=A0AA94L2Y5_DESDE|nr:Helix-turn-helix [Desulfovibrio desulfuricans]SPD34827.1 Lambda repressor-like, DNA-binding domain [Desulfovibrio sp. G11]
MLDSILKAPQEIRRDIAARAQARRLALNMSQKELAARSGVSLGSVKRFETTGEISLSSLLSIAMVLNDLEAFAGLFSPPRPENLFTLEEPTPRKRAGRKRHES